MQDHNKHITTKEDNLMVSNVFLPSYHWLVQVLLLNLRNTFNLMVANALQWEIWEKKVADCFCSQIRGGLLIVE